MKRRCAKPFLIASRKKLTSRLFFVSSSLNDRWGKAKAMTKSDQMERDLIEVASGDATILGRNRDRY